MSVELLQNLALAGYMASGVFLAITVILFFVLKVPELIGDLSGMNARKAIEDIRRQNEETGHKAFKPSPVNAARGKLTDKISQSGRLIPRTGRLSPVMEGKTLGTQKLDDQAGQETTVLQQNPQFEETQDLTEAPLLVQMNQTKPDGMTVDFEICFTESREIIE